MEQKNRHTICFISGFVHYQKLETFWRTAKFRTCFLGITSQSTTTRSFDGQQVVWMPWKNKFCSARKQDSKDSNDSNSKHHFLSRLNVFTLFDCHKVKEFHQQLSSCGKISGSSFLEVLRVALKTELYRFAKQTSQLLLQEPLELKFFPGACVYEKKPYQVNCFGLSAADGQTTVSRQSIIKSFRLHISAFQI